MTTTVTPLRPIHDGQPAIVALTPAPGAASTAAPVGMSHDRRPTREGRDDAGEFATVDLCGLDYDERRRHLIAAVYGLNPGDGVEVVSDGVDDVSWLRYEIEARLPQRCSWSLPQEAHGTVHTTIWLPPRCA